MSNDRRQIQTRLDQRGHFVPGFEHLTAIDAFDEETFKDDFVPVDGHIRRWNTQHRNTAAVIHGIEHSAERRWCARHLQTDVKAFGHAQLCHHIGQALFGDIHRAGDAHFARQRQAVFVHVGDHDVARAHVFRDCRRHNTDWACARDQHVFTHQIEGERGVHRVAERVEDGGQIVRDIVRDFERVERRDHQIFREAARTVYAHTDGIAAQVSTSTATVTAVAAGNVAFTGDAVTNFKAFHFLADPDHFADIFVAHNHRHRDGFLRPLVPVVDVNVSTTDGCFTNFDQQIVMTDFRLRHVGHPNPFFCFQFG